jgi:hypothetical protein
VGAVILLYRGGGGLGSDFPESLLTQFSSVATQKVGLLLKFSTDFFHLLFVILTCDPLDATEL